MCIVTFLNTHRAVYPFGQSTCTAAPNNIAHTNQ